jgi:hypothetical protein
VFYIEKPDRWGWIDAAATLFVLVAVVALYALKASGVL